MARVPVIQDSAQLDVGTGRQRIQAGPDAFGGQEARALQNVQQGINTVARVAEEKDDEFSEAEARELDNELTRRIRERLTGPEGYLSTQRGRNAIERRTQTEAEVDELAAEIGTRTTNPRARAMYLRSAQARVGDALGRIADHSARESTSYLNEQSEARLLEFADDAAASYGDEGRVLELLNGADGEIRTLGQRRGWDEEIIAQRTRQFRSDVMSRTIVLVAATDPEAAETLFERYRPSLTAQEAGELQTTMRAVRRESEDAVIDEAWTHVAAGRQIPAELWARVPGRAQIDIQNERRRRAEGGAGGGNRTLIEDLRVESVADPEAFARRDLRSIRGQLGSSYDEFAIAQVEIRQGGQSADVTERRTTFNAVRDIAASTLNLNLTPAERAPEAERNRASAFNAALLREVEAHMTANPGAPINAETTQILIGRAYVGMRGRLVTREQGRVSGVPNRERFGRRNNSGVDVAPTTEVVVPYAAIPADLRLQLGTRLRQRLRRTPTRGEVENAYAAFLQGRPLQIGSGQ